jgi:hypothetical protein
MNKISAIIIHLSILSFETATTAAGATDEGRCQAYQQFGLLDKRFAGLFSAVQFVIVVFDARHIYSSVSPHKGGILQKRAQ